MGPAFGEIVVEAGNSHSLAFTSQFYSPFSIPSLSLSFLLFSPRCCCGLGFQASLVACSSAATFFAGLARCQLVGGVSVEFGEEDG